VVQITPQVLSSIFEVILLARSAEILQKMIVKDPQHLRVSDMSLHYLVKYKRHLLNTAQRSVATRLKRGGMVTLKLAKKIE